MITCKIKQIVLFDLRLISLSIYLFSIEFNVHTELFQKNSNRKRDNKAESYRVIYLLMNHSIKSLRWIMVLKVILITRKNSKKKINRSLRNEDLT